MNLVIAVPTRGSVDWNVITRLDEIREANQLPPIHYQAGRLAVQDVRNRIVHWFLEDTQAEWLLQVDDDVIPKRTVLDMIKHDVDIVGAPYFTHRPGELPMPAPTVYRFHKETAEYRIIESPFGRDALTECDAIGTGCLLVRRRVFEDKDLKIPFQAGFDQWGQMVLTEDIRFCEKARRAGYKVYADFAQFADHFVQGISLNSIMNGMMEVFKAANK